MRSIFAKAKVLLFLAAILMSARVVKATGEEPVPFQFSYGTRISFEQPDLEQTLQIVKETGFEWIAVDYLWRDHWPRQTTSPKWEQLDTIMAFAREQDIAVMVSLTASPNWATGEIGPSPPETAHLVIQLVDRYSQSLKAIELFPAPNTTQGWGAKPDPVHYAQLLNYLNQTLEANNQNLKIITGGLIPSSTTTTLPSDIDHIKYLEGFYKAQNSLGETTPLPIIGFRPLTLTGDSHSVDISQGAMIRYYEQIHQIMFQNGHHNGYIWVTGFSWPSHLTTKEDHETLKQQTLWLQETYQQMSDQACLEATFFTPKTDTALSSRYAYFALQGLHQQIHIANQAIHNASPTINYPKSAPKFYTKLSLP